MQLSAIIARLDALLEWNQPLKEHQLIKQLQREQLLPDYSLHDQFSLFHLHFLLFHSLYLLRNNYRSNASADLQIDALAITKIRYTPGSDAVTTADPLASYYLDLSNLTNTTAEDVTELLDNFWNGLAQPVCASALHEALVILELENPVDMSTAKKQYQRLLMQHHPDRGGDHQKVIAINEAMSTLKQHFRSTR